MQKIKVKLENRVLMVPAEDKEKYLQQGYEIYTEDGKLIEKPQTQAEAELAKVSAENAELKAKLDAAESEIFSLKEKLENSDNGNDDAKAECETLKAELAKVSAENAELKAKLEKPAKTPAKKTADSAKEE